MPRMPKNPCNPEFIVRLLYGDFPQNQSHTLVQTGGGKKVSLVFREDLHNIAIPFTVSSLKHVSTRRQDLARHFARTAECHNRFLVPCVRLGSWCSSACDKRHKQPQLREFPPASH